MGRDLENKTARPEFVKSFNYWGMKLWGKYTVSPTINVVGLTANSERPGGKNRKALESGKSDLTVCFIDKEQRPLLFAIEVKAFSGGKLDMGILRENQREWADTTTFGFAYWIALWGYLTELPVNFRTKAARENKRAWLLPLDEGESTEMYLLEKANTRTLWYGPGPGCRVQARENNIFISPEWDDYELTHNGKYWIPNPDHVLYKTLGVDYGELAYGNEREKSRIN